MAKRPRPTDQDTEHVRVLVLSGLALGVELPDIATRLGPFHPRHNTFPGEVCLELGADAIDHSGATRANPIEFEDIRERFMPELNLRSRDEHYKSKWPIRAAAMIHGGVDPGLLDEVSHWRMDDFWEWALDAAVIYVRAAADRLGVDAADVARTLAARHNLVLLDQAAWDAGPALSPTWLAADPA